MHPALGIWFVVGLSLSGGAIAQRSTDLQLIGPGKKLTEKDLASLPNCKFVYKLRAGMTNSEAADAIDAGFNKFITCINAAVLKEKSK
jgi:hypothetical protein